MQTRELGKDEYVKLSQSFSINVLQTYEWGEVKKYNWKPLRLGFFDGQKCKSLYTVFLRKVPLTYLTFGYIPRGIAVSSPNDFDQVILDLRTFMKNKTAFLLIDPDNRLQIDSENDEFISALRSSGFKEIDEPIQPNSTNVIDMRKSIDELLQEMRSKTRQYIRKGEKKNLTVEKRDVHHINNFFDILQSLEDERGYSYHGKEYYEQIMKEFGDSASLFFVKEKTDILGAVLCITHGKWVYEMYGGCNNYGKNTKAPYTLKWEMIKYFKNRGFEFYDQWGTDQRYPGLIQFKNGFGGIHLQFLKQYGFIYNQFGYLAYKTGLKIRSILKK